jgi:DNA-binding response OmpR family regulator
VKLLIVDDRKLFRSGLSNPLEHRDIEVTAVGRGSEGLKVLERTTVDIVPHSDWASISNWSGGSPP